MIGVGLEKRAVSLRRELAGPALAGLALIGLVFSGSGCHKRPADRDPSTTVTRQETRPAWVDALIARIEQEPVRNPPAQVARYLYNDKLVYFVPSYCCDTFSDLYSAAGEVICHPDGGLTGKGDGRCADFSSARRAEKILWQDPRKPAK